MKYNNLTTPFLRAFTSLFIILATSGARASETKVNPVTGYTETYSNKFIGDTAEWNLASNWDTGVLPFIANGNGYSASLVDGKTASTTTKIDGWNLQVGAYNGASITWSNLGKIQGSTTMWLTVDSTSSITINGWGSGYLGQKNQKLNYYVANAQGVKWGVDFASGEDQGGFTMCYYLAGSGSVAYKKLERAAQVIKQADITLAIPSAGKTVRAKTLVSFTSSSKTFTADATIKRFNYDGSAVENVELSEVKTSKTLTTDDDVGTCELVQTSTGILLYYVDYGRSSINVNFTNGNGLTTYDNVGLTGYEVPGTAWNNFVVGNNTTFSPVTAVDSTGSASTAAGVSVRISGTRGHWKCESLAPSSNPLHGYIDEDANNTTPTVTISGIPYDKYRVIVYHSTDTANTGFGYDTINNTDYTYTRGVLGRGTTSWGDSGVKDGANAIAEGVNVLVSPVIAGSTATIVAHKIGENRGCIAAVQIVGIPVAKINTTVYYSLASAINAAQNGDTITTLEACEGSDINLASKDITFGSFTGTASNLYLTGSSLSIGDGVDLEVTTMLRTTHSGANACSITQNGGSLTCSGAAQDGYKLGAFVLSHWGATTTYSLSGGTLTVENSAAKFGADGTGNMTISGTGVANFHSLSLRRGTLTVGSGGTLNLGAAGQTSPVSRNEGNLTLNGGTMGAWSSDAITIPVPVSVSGNSTIRASTVLGAAATVIFTGAITGSGNLTITGGGKVVFAGNMSSYTGSFAVGSGTLEVPSGVSVTSVASGAAVLVSNTPEELEGVIYGCAENTATVRIPESVEGTVMFVDSAGNPIAGASSTWENGVRSFSGTLPANGAYTGNRWVWDYEFNGNVKSIGSDTGEMTQEGSGTSFTTADSSGNQELYFQKTPYRGASFSSYTEMTAVMYCAPGNYANTVLIGFGSTYASNNCIALVTGEQPDKGDMELVLIERPNNNTDVTVTQLASLRAVDATTKKHLYAFVMVRITENGTQKTRIRVYMDGKVKAIYKHDSTLALGDGFQIGSCYGGLHGVNGATWDTGLAKYPASGDSGTLDFLRVTNAALSDGAMAILANTYPYESAHGEATRDPISSAADWVSTDAWTQTVPGEDDATQNAPNADTNVKLSIDGSSAVSVALNLETDSNYESVAFTKKAGATGSLKVTSDYNNETTGKLVSAETSVLVDTTVPAGRVNLGITSVGDDVTLTVDPMTTTVSDIMLGLAFGGVYEDTVISMALLGDGASVVLDSTGVSTLAGYGFTAELIYNPANQSYTFKLTREAATADITVDIAAGGATTWSTRGIAVPAPESLPNTYAGTVTITSASESPVTIATSFAGGNVTVASGGPVTLAGEISTSGTVTLNSATTLSGNTVSSALTGSGAVTIDGTVTLADGGSIANTISGTGTIDCSSRSSLPSAFAFGTWTGTVVLPVFDAATYGVDFNHYGVSGSKIRFNGMTAGWLQQNENSTTETYGWRPKANLELAGLVNITGLAKRWYQFQTISGSGSLSFSSNTEPDDLPISCLANFTGSITNNLAKTISVGTLALNANADITPGSLLLKTGGSGSISIGSIMVGGEAVSGITLERRNSGAADDGYYVAQQQTSTGEGANEVVTVDTDKNSATVSVDANYAGKVVVPAKVSTLSITGASVAAANIGLKVSYGESTTATYYGIVTVAGNGAVTLDPAGVVNDVKVEPEVAESSPMTLGDTTPGFTVKTIPGLYYVAETCSTPDGTFTSAGTPQQATSVSTTLSTNNDSWGENEKVKYYRIKVSTTDN